MMVVPVTSKKGKGLYLESSFLKYLCKIMFEQELYFKDIYEKTVDFFEQVLNQEEISLSDRNDMEKYYSGFKDKHASRYKLGVI